MLACLMERRGLRQAGMAPILKSRDHVSDVLKGK